MAEYDSKYKIGDFVLYGLNGTCKIVDIGPLDFGGPDKIYYSMKPVSDARSTIYLPLTKEEEILRGVMSKDEAKQVVEGIKKSKPATYSPVRENCDVILKSGDNVAVSSMIKLLRNMRKENRKIHKGLNIFSKTEFDFNFFHEWDFLLVQKAKGKGLRPLGAVYRYYRKNREKIKRPGEHLIRRVWERTGTALEWKGVRE